MHGAWHLRLMKNEFERIYSVDMSLAPYLTTQQWNFLVAGGCIFYATRVIATWASSWKTRRVY
jgi:hypothetical protein